MHYDEYQKMFEAEDRYWWFVARRRLALSLLRWAVGDLRDRKILDLGCGTGAALLDLSASGADVVGADFSAHALELSRSRGVERLVNAEGEALPFQANSFEAAIALDIYEHIEDVESALRETCRVLRPGGALVLSVPAYRWLWGPHDVALMHFRRYTRSQMGQALREAGFVPEKVSYSVFFLFPAVMLVRLVDRFRHGPARVALPPVSAAVNALLTWVMGCEMRLVQTITLPWGSSVIAVARKPAGPSGE